MKEKIYTIPVNEGFDADSECPFCTIYEKLEKDALNYTMGPSYMEQDVRDMTNEKGFCNEHYKMMYDSHNRLGLALMVSTHMAKIQKEMDAFLEDEKRQKSFFRRNKKSEVNPLSQYIEKLGKSCFICEKIDANMERYFNTFFYLWKKEDEFREKVKKSKGFCLKHFERLLTLSEKELLPKQRAEFVELLIKKQNENTERVREDLQWFISKFDYRFKDEPWGNSKDVLNRAIIKTASHNVEKKLDEGM